MSTWQLATPLNHEHFGLAAVQGIYAVGGTENLNDVEYYQLGNAQWQAMPPLNTGRYWFAAVEVDGYIYALGGMDAHDTLIQAPYTVEMYDPAAQLWSYAAPLQIPRASLAAAVGPDGRIYAFGGMDAHTANIQEPHTVEVYDPSQPQQGWQFLSPQSQLPTPRSGLAAATGPDGYIYVIGGLSQDGKPLAVVEAYHPATDTWNQPAVPPAMPTARGTLAAVTGPDGRIYALGGSSGAGSLSTVEVYDVSAGWKTLPSMQSRREQLAASMDGTNIYAIGGSDQLTGVFSTVEYYSIPCQNIQNQIDTVNGDLQTIEIELENMDDVPPEDRASYRSRLLAEARRLRKELSVLEAELQQCRQANP